MIESDIDAGRIAKRISDALLPVLEKAGIPPVPNFRSKMSVSEKAEFIRKNGSEAYLRLPA